MFHRRQSTASDSDPVRRQLLWQLIYKGVQPGLLVSGILIKINLTKVDVMALNAHQAFNTFR